MSTMTDVRGRTLLFEEQAATRLSRTPQLALEALRPVLLLTLEANARALVKGNEERIAETTGRLIELNHLVRYWLEIWHAQKQAALN